MSSTGNNPSRSWRRTDLLPRRNYSSSDGAASFLSSGSPSDDQFRPPAAIRGSSSRQPHLLPLFSEGTSRAEVGGHESCSDGGSENESGSRTRFRPSRRGSSFKSKKLVHPVAGDCGSSSSSSAEDGGGHRCGLCERLLSSRSPWSSRRGLLHGRGDMPVAGVLACRHAFHAECLERTTPRGCCTDPPCPLCPSRLTSLEEEKQEGSSRPWSCVRAGDCVQGALQAAPPKRSQGPRRNQAPEKTGRRKRRECL